jgi:hypothetical protein
MDLICYSCCRPIVSGPVLGEGKLHCSFECAAETGRLASAGHRALPLMAKAAVSTPVVTVMVVRSRKLRDSAKLS